MPVAASGQSPEHTLQTETALEVEMNAEPAPEKDKELPTCGRLVFRGVELAYLNIDGEYMLPLAELLALVLPSTPRTTLFTRMEKMKVRRHFCQPEEIRLLKTVNGIHGSSANCTLLSKTEVDKYCSMYIDNLSESNKGKCTENIVNDSKVHNEEDRAENCKAKPDMESAHRNNSEIPNKLAVPSKHKKSPPLKAKLKLSKISNSMKLKSALSSDSLFNQTLTDTAGHGAIDFKTRSSVNGNGEGILPVSSKPFCGGHVSQTQPLLANNKRLKRRAKNLNSEMNKTGKTSREKKRPRNDDFETRQEFEAPLKIPKRSETYRQRKEIHKLSKTSEFHCVHTLQSSQKNDSVVPLVSDSSSNDSGFGSAALSNASTPTKTDFSAVELTGLLKKDEEAIKEHERSPLRPPKLNCMKTPPKTRKEETDGSSLTLSPPALVLKRYEDSWQVEQKSPVKKVVNCLLKSKVKSKKKARLGGLCSLFDENCGQTRGEYKQVKKKRKRKQPLSLKEETLSTKHHLIVGENIDVSAVKKKKKKKRKKKGKFNGEGNLLKEQVVGAEKNNYFSKAETPPQEKLSSKTQLIVKGPSKEELLKKDLVLDRLVGDALAKFFGPKPSSFNSTPSTSESTPNDPKPKKPKVAGPKKPVLKTNSNFKLLDLFPVTSQLSLQDGSLGTMFTMSCPKGVKPPSSHPLWKWRLGGPVVRESAHKFLKPHPIQKPKKVQPGSATKIICNKVRKLKTKRRKRLLTNKVSLSSVSLSVCENADHDSRTNQSVSVAPCDSNLPGFNEAPVVFCHPSSAKITVH